MNQTDEECYQEGLKAFHATWRGHWKRAVEVWKQLPHMQEARTAIAICYHQHLGFPKKETFDQSDAKLISLIKDSAIKDDEEYFKDSEKLDALMSELMRVYAGTPIRDSFRDKSKPINIIASNFVRAYFTIMQTSSQWKNSDRFDEPEAVDSLVAMVENGEWWAGRFLSWYLLEQKGTSHIWRSLSERFKTLMILAKCGFASASTVFATYYETDNIPDEIDMKTRLAGVYFANFADASSRLEWLAKNAERSGEVAYAAGREIEAKELERAEEFFAIGARLEHRKSKVALWRVQLQTHPECVSKIVEELCAFVKETQDEPCLSRYLLGECYMRGIGVEKDLEKGLKFLSDGCLRAFRPAVYNLARRHRALERTKWSNLECEYSNASSRYNKAFFAFLLGKEEECEMLMREESKEIRSRITGPFGGGHAYLYSGMARYVPHIRPENTFALAECAYAYALSGLLLNVPKERIAEYRMAAKAMGVPCHTESEINLMKLFDCGDLKDAYAPFTELAAAADFEHSEPQVLFR